MSKSIFREKSLERISSPEQLNDYIRVSNPGIWTILISVLLLLGGVMIWGIFGRLDSSVPMLVVSENGKVMAYIREEDADKAATSLISQMEQAQPFEVSGVPCRITKISDESIAVKGMDAYYIHVGQFEPDEWVYSIELSGDVPEGVTLVDYLTGSVSPMSFVTN